MMYNVVSLFAGCGGCDQGMVGGFNYNNTHYQPLPFNIVYALDNNPKALDTHKLNFACANVVCSNIQDVNEDDVPECDVIVGGFPCQSFSTVNPIKDPFDDRANLYKHMVRILQAKKPKVFIAENVKGFMKLYKGLIFETVCSAFKAVGYRVYAELLNAANYGVPQKRERVIIVGVRKDITNEFLFPEPTTQYNWVPLSVAVPVLAIDDKKYYFSDRAVQGMKNAKNNMKRGLAQNLDEPCLTITSHLAKVSINSRDPVLLVDRERELYRRFTPNEAARIQSFPDTFRFAGTESDAYRQIGNAVPPVLFCRIANAVTSVL